MEKDKKTFGCGCKKGFLKSYLVSECTKLSDYLNMKILFLSDDFPPASFGGAGISTYELALGMVREGHEVFAITTCRKKIDEGEIEYKGLKVFKISSDYPERWRAYVSLNNTPVVRRVELILKDLRPDVVHINNIHFHLSYRCFTIAKRYAKAVVFTARDTMSVCYGKLGTDRYLKKFEYRTTWVDHIRYAKKRYNPFYNFFVRKYLASADKRFSVSEALQKGLVENGIKDVIVIHTGANVAEWGAQEEEKKHFRNTYALDGKKVVLYGGRLSEGKGGGKTLEAFIQIKKEIPNAVLLVAGSVDAYAVSMKKQAEEAGIGDALIITGWLDSLEIRVAYAVSDLVVVPSFYLDPFPRIVIEAMASGRPVLGSCYGGSPEIIVDGVTGYIVNPGQPEEIAEKAIDLLNDSEKSEQFGRAGYERVKKDFNIENKVKEYILAYESVLTKKLLQER